MKNLILVSGDIIENANKYNIEAIVNPANKYMDYGSGVCGAIYDKAGIDQLENYCHNKWNKDMEVNEIRITTGFALLKDIIHIYAPRYYEEQQPIEKLKEGYLKLFEVIIKEGYKSVIIPSLGTGFHCYTHEEVAEMVINLLNEFCKNNDVKIIFDLVDDETKAIYEQYIYNNKSIKMNNKNDKRLPSTNELKEVFEELSETMKEELLKEEELSSQILEEKEDDLKIYNIFGIKRMFYIKKYTNGLNNINLKYVKQIETDYYNNIYVLLDNGYLLENGELQDNDIDRLYMVNGFSLYKITNDNIIKPIDDVYKSDLDIYLNNEDYKYKKIISDPLYLVALTEEGTIKSSALSGIPIGIIPENFVGVDDIFIKDDNVYIIKQGKEISLYVTN
ncbi:macro domain protein [Clostridium sp. CAG:798]|nr:macro domain protein [Clostridium sp. CAG:798]